jgi:hypothetical protein
VIFELCFQVKIVTMTSTQNNRNISPTPSPSPSPFNRLVNMVYATRAEDSIDKHLYGMNRVKSPFEEKSGWLLNTNVNNGWFTKTKNVNMGLDSHTSRVFPLMLMTEKGFEIFPSDIRSAFLKKSGMFGDSLKVIFDKCTDEKPEHVLHLSTGCILNMAFQIYDFEGDNQAEFNKIIRTHIDPGYVEPEGVLRERLLELVELILELD